MKKTLFVALVVLAFGLVGCGGGGGSSTNPFAGSASGVWSSITGDPENGTVSVMVLPDGTTTGTGTNATDSSTFTVVGTIQKNGDADLTYTYPDLTVRCQGTLRVVAGHILGDVTLSVGGVEGGTATVDLTKS